MTDDHIRTNTNAPIDRFTQHEEAIAIADTAKPQLVIAQAPTDTTRGTIGEMSKREGPPMEPVKPDVTLQQW